MKKKKSTPEKKPKSKSKPLAKKSKSSNKLKSSEKISTELNPLGKKHTCYACGKKFYDLNKPQAICPSCGADQKSKPAQKFRAAKMRYSEFEVGEEEGVVPLDEELEFEEDVEMEEEPVLDEE